MPNWLVRIIYIDLVVEMLWAAAVIYGVAKLGPWPTFVWAKLSVAILAEVTGLTTVSVFGASWLARHNRLTIGRLLALAPVAVIVLQAWWAISR